MLKTFLLALIILLPAIILMGVKVFFTKNGKFPNTHVSANPYLRKNKVGCVQSQDRENQKKIKPIKQ